MPAAGNDAEQLQRARIERERPRGDHWLTPLELRQHPLGTPQEAVGRDEQASQTLVHPIVAVAVHLTCDPGVAVCDVVNLVGEQLLAHVGVERLEIRVGSAFRRPDEVDAVVVAEALQIALPTPGVAASRRSTMRDAENSCFAALTLKPLRGTHSSNSSLRLCRRS